MTTNKNKKSEMSLTKKQYASLYKKAKVELIRAIQSKKAGLATPAFGLYTMFKDLNTLFEEINLLAGGQNLELEINPK